MQKVTVRKIEDAKHYKSYNRAYRLSRCITTDPRVIQDNDGRYVACGDKWLIDGKVIQLYGAMKQDRKGKKVNLYIMTR